MSAARLLPDSVPLALAWRYAAHAAMVALALTNESRAAPRLSDLVLDHLPRSAWVAQWNYWIWLALYVPLACALWRLHRAAFVHFLWVGGFVSLVRGLCVPLTLLGPAYGADVNAGIAASSSWDAWLSIVNPWSALFSDAPHVALTKDLFFSGHVSSTFLLWLYCRRQPGLGPLALAAHLLVVASVFLAHLHYTIDVVGAWGLTYALWAPIAARWPVPDAGVAT